MSPDVSIIMPVYNAEKYLNQAILSILDQSLTSFEFIIINDGSTDSSLRIIQSFHDSRIILLNQNNKGIACALNEGIKKSSAKIIARMDADDISEKFRLAIQFEYLKNNPHTVLIGSDARVIDMTGKYIYTSNVPADWAEIRKSIPFFPIYHSSAMFRKESVLKAGLYDERVSLLNAFEDQLLWNNLIAYGVVENIKIPLIQYRLQPGASTSKSSNEGKLAKYIIPELVSGRYPDMEIASLIKLKKALTKNKKYFNYYIYIAKKYLFESRCRREAFRHCIIALRYKPFGMKAISYLILCLLPFSLIRRIKHRYQRERLPLNRASNSLFLD